MARERRETPTSLAEVDTRERERRIAALGERQHRVVDVHQLGALGLRPNTVRARAAAGRLVRQYRGVYALGPGRLTKRGQWLAAVMACGEGALLSHRSAAALHGL